MYKAALTFCPRLPRATLWVVIAVVLSVSPVFAQKKGGKPSPTPPSLENSAIVYISGDSINVADADGTNQATLLSRRRTQFRNPSWSPDGNTIIFASDLEGPAIYYVTINRNTGQIGVPTRITLLNSEFVGLARPVWSAENKIAYSDTAPGGSDYYIFLVDIAIDTSGEWQFGTPFQLTQPAAGKSDLYPSWSPDATQIVVSQSSDTASPPYDIQILTLGSGNECNGQAVCEIGARESLVRYPKCNGLPCASPAQVQTADTLLAPTWANGGTQIAVSVSMPETGSGDIWIIPIENAAASWNLTDTNVTNVPSNDRHETSPTWSPDDSQIMYQAWDYLCQPQTNKERGYNLIVRKVGDGQPGPNFDPPACEEKMIVEGGGYPGASSPNWWRGPNSVSP